MSSKKEMALTRQDNGFLRLADFNMAGMMAEELDGLDMSFERIKIPSAGSTVFEVPGENPGEPDTVREFSAVILYHHPLHAYYKTKYTGGNQPPDCGSFDGITGEGDPGGNCAACPLNRFGTGENGSKACKNRRRIYVLREGEIFPLLLSLPTGSLKEFTKYIKRLLSKGRKSNSVVTRFSLKKATNSGGIAYSQAQFAIDRPLTSEEYALIGKLSEQVREYSRRVGFEADNTAETDIDEAPFADPETGEVIEPLK
ncbi:hypothetical protein [Petrotoga olearia]|uniref:Uncharacterized protein n=2 Tax=Petrotoga olearia TaxID=156203 RepID=A0A2K1P5F0_9BACT|nr:hypothetical protein [Petrotoga olearia]PNR98014.1 hypothetical protein X929_01220 [Petrotoga olearia DSM 13574]RMA75599.1 hypothetical protein C8D75_0606 [Petrotoga olearia]